MSLATITARHFSDGERFVTISECTVRSLYQEASASDHRETGGVLLGHYSDKLDRAVVLEATGPPPDSRRTQYTFVRGREGLHELLLARWHQEPRKHYLGEWHSHPTGQPRPSAQDRAALAGVARDPLYRCRTPLLLIVAPASDAEKSLGVWFADGRGERVELHHLPERFEPTHGSDDFAR